MNTVARKPLQASLLARHWQNDVFFLLRHIERQRNIPPNLRHTLLQGIAAVALLLIRRLTLTRLKLTF